MRLAVRRAVGVAGATAVAIGAALVLALPASAHNWDIKPGCSDGQMTLSINLTQYQLDHGKKKNTVVATDTLPDGTVITLLPTTKFGTSFKANFDASTNPATGAADVDNTFHVVVTAWDDTDFKKGWSEDFSKTVTPCVTGTPTSVPPSSVPPSSVPPTSVPPTSVPATVPPTTTTSEAVVAAATTTPGSGQLPYTGVNATFPLLIAGILVIAGGGLLFWLRFSARRRNAG